jgi:hypothetical protein
VAVCIGDVWQVGRATVQVPSPARRGARFRWTRVERNVPFSSIGTWAPASAAFFDERPGFRPPGRDLSGLAFAWLGGRLLGRDPPFNQPTIDASRVRLDRKPLADQAGDPRGGPEPGREAELRGRLLPPGVDPPLLGYLSSRRYGAGQGPTVRPDPSRSRLAASQPGRPLARVEVVGDIANLSPSLTAWTGRRQRRSSS